MNEQQADKMIELLEAIKENAIKTNSNLTSLKLKNDRQQQKIVELKSEIQSIGRKFNVPIRVCM